VNEDQEDKYNVFPFHFEVLQFLLLILDFVFFAGLKLLDGFIGNTISLSMLIFEVV
jgi:hypothetical protein